jgi:isopentenyl diphosphate isomerase/L-lactate dehydrogenase-like FMN-dependent dehydrogenase
MELGPFHVNFNPQKFFRGNKTSEIKMELWFDGGIRYGEDIFKALALGADFVFIGRPVMWGASVGGVEGCRQVLDILEGELKLAMGLAGCLNVAGIGREYVVTAKDRIKAILVEGMDEILSKKFAA